MGSREKAGGKRAGHFDSVPEVCFGLKHLGDVQVWDSKEEISLPFQVAHG